MACPYCEDILQPLQVERTIQIAVFDLIHYFPEMFRDFRPKYSSEDNNINETKLSITSQYSIIK